jgi:hypothetical protein
LKSKLKSPPSEDAQGKFHPIRRLYACSFASGARDTAESVTSWVEEVVQPFTGERRGRKNQQNGDDAP